MHNLTDESEGPELNYDPTADAKKNGQKVRGKIRTDSNLWFSTFLPILSFGTFWLKASLSNDYKTEELLMKQMFLPKKKNDSKVKSLDLPIRL